MFGKSVFQSVLQRLQDEDEDQTGDQAEGRNLPQSSSVRGLNAGFVANVKPSRLGESESITRAYYETASDDMLAPAKPAAVPVIPDHLRRTAPGEIADDLGLGHQETPASLAEKRRSFASLNHPDRHDPQFRQQATIRMKIANMLIDEALRRIKRR